MEKITTYAPTKKCKLVMADQFLYMVEMVKSVWFSGRFGGGKTAGCYALASWLYGNRKVDRIFSNIPDAISSDVTAPVQNTCIILDEAWQYLEGWNDVKSYAAYLRKLKLILAMPSVFPPNARLRMLATWRVWDGYTAGIPVWVYKWSMSMNGIRESGYWGIWNPSAIFGMFDTNFIPMEDNGIVDAINKTIELEGGLIKDARKGKQTAKKLTAAQQQAADTQAAMADSSTAFAEAVEEVARKIRRK